MTLDNDLNAQLNGQLLKENMGHETLSVVVNFNSQLDGYQNHHDIGPLGRSVGNFRLG